MVERGNAVESNRDSKIADESRVLPLGTVLNGRYEIQNVLGEGGFAITYLAKDGEKGGKPVAVKEYFPSYFGARNNDGSNGLHVFSENKDRFEKGMRRFLRESKVLGDFQHLDGIASVYDCFRENNTAYIVMEYIEGITLMEYVKDQGVLPYSELVSLLSPIMRALIQIHRQGVIHRDISPDNIIIGLDNRARLIDFGAVGIINDSSREDDYGKTVILKTGYAPPEQYVDGGRLGPWTDVYGMAATIYMGITGTAPMDTVERLQLGEEKSDEEIYAFLTNNANGNIVEDADKNLSLHGKGLLPWQARAVITGISLSVDKRYSDMSELYDALTTAPSIEKNVTVEGSGVVLAAHNVSIAGKGERKAAAGHRKEIPLILSIVSLFMVLVMSVILGIILAGQKDRNNVMDVDGNISVNESVDSGHEGRDKGDEDSGRGESGNSSEALEDGGTEAAASSSGESRNSSETLGGKSSGTDSDAVKESEKESDTSESKVSGGQNNSKKQNKEEKINIHEDDSMEHLIIE